MIKTNKAIEKRIHDDIIVDAYDDIEVAMGWYYYMEEKLQFPFKAKCVEERDTSPLSKDEVVEVIELASEDDCEHEMFVKIKWTNRKLAVPLSQLTGVKVNAEIKQAIGDWKYWMGKK
jgi:hypothetical protein